MDLDSTARIVSVGGADLIEPQHGSGGIIQLIMVDLMGGERRIERQLDIGRIRRVLHL